MPTNSKTLSWRMSQVEMRCEKLDDKVDEILQNHLPHIMEEIASLKTRINVSTVINVGAIILVSLILKNI